MAAVPEFRWLHISDLHVGLSDEAVVWPSARNALLEDLDFVAQRVGPFDVVIFTGDLTQRGDREEFRRLESTFLVDLWNVGGGPDTVLLAVPGNHDLVRPEPTNATARGLVADPVAREGLFSGDMHTLNFISERFAAYTAWWNSTAHRPDKGYQPGLLPGDFSYIHQKAGFRVGFVGANSAWLQLLDGAKPGSLHVDVRQVLSACGGDLVTWLGGQPLNFLLTHHPPSWLSPESRAKFEEYFAAAGWFTGHLFGHMHEPRTESTRIGGGAVRWVCQAASLFGLERIDVVADGRVVNRVDRSHGFIAGHADVTGGSVKLTLWPRRGVRTQDATWRIASDWSFHLENDLANVRSEVLPVTVAGPAIGAPATPAFPMTSEEEHDWVVALERSELWKLLDRSTRSAALPSLVRRLVAASQETCRTVAAACEDPWSDPGWPLRALGRAAEYLRNLRQALTEERLALLMAAPFLRAAIIAEGSQRLLAVAPFDFAPGPTENGLRRRLEREHAAHESLTRRSDRFAEADRRAVGLWLLHQAVRRWPALWRGETGLISDRVGSVVTELETVLFPGHGGSRLLALARSTAGEPRAIARRGEGLLPINVRGDSLDPAELAYVLCLAGHAAFDVAMADEAAVEHVGVDPEFRLADLRQAVARAAWARDGRRHVLHARCSGQVVDFLLRSFVTGADQVLQDIHASWPGESRPQLLVGLPDRLSADGVVPDTSAGREPYRLPHVRFRLDHNRIRDLLMGERLYGDPNLAVRELYQNALDACRYRRARQDCATRLERYHGEAYRGRIVLRQGQDGGREFIECQDNGVGMTEGVLEQIFAVAGRRFHDSTEFAEERAEWERLELRSRFVPNSQFGIGVLSYFMLADELEIRTRTLLRDGRRGDPLIARISSAAGLFRLEKGLQDEPGTTVRLYLGAHAEKTRCRDILERLLWVTEFETVVEDGGLPLRWEANQVGPAGSGRETYLREVIPGELWWSMQPGPVLADGIATEESAQPELAAFFLVNLRGHRYPRLSVDRKRIVSWESGWLDDVMSSAWDRLADWESLTIEFMWRLEAVRPSIARMIFSAAVAKERSILTFVDQPRQFPIAKLGCFSADRTCLRDDGPESFDPYFVRWRASVLRSEGFPVGRLRFFEGNDRPQRVPDRRPEPGDAKLLEFVSHNVVHVGPQFVLPRFAGAVVCSAVTLSPAETEARLTSYAVVRLAPNLSFPAFPANFIASLDEVDRRLLSVNLNGRAPWIDSRLSVEHLCRAAGLLELPMATVRRRLENLSMLGFELPAERLPEIELDRTARRILSWNGDGRAPWRLGPQSFISVLAQALKLESPVGEVSTQLSGLALLGVSAASLPEVVRDADELLRDEIVRVILRTGLLTDLPDRLPAAAVVALHSAVSVPFGVTDLAQGLARLGVIVDGDVMDAAERLEGWPGWRRMQETDFGGPSKFLFPESGLEAAYGLLSATIECGLNLGELATSLSGVGLVDAAIAERVRALSATIPLARNDMPLIDAVPWGRYTRDAGTDINRIWFDWARFKLWERPESELHDRIATLAPFFGAAVT